MHNKLQATLDKVKSLASMLPFGLKAADDKIVGSASMDGLQNSTTIQQKVESKNVFKDLLKGELTEAVKELRYSSYAISRKADEYDYVKECVRRGKVSFVDELNKGEKHKFTQECKPIYDGFLDSLKAFEDGTENIQKHTLSLAYSDFVKFKMERYAKYVEVDYKGTNDAYTTLRFFATPDPNDQTSVVFSGELKKLKEAFEKGDTKMLDRLTFATSVVTMNFVTYGASNNEPNLIEYMFVRPTLTSVKFYNNEYLLTYKWEECHRVDLTDKYFNQAMADKYAKQARTEYSPSFMQAMEAKYGTKNVEGRGTVYVQTSSGNIEPRTIHFKADGKWTIDEED